MNGISKGWKIAIMLSWALTLLFVLLWGATQSRLLGVRFELSQAKAKKLDCKLEEKVKCEKCKPKFEHAISHYGRDEENSMLRYIRIDGKGNVYAICVNKETPNEK